MRWAAGPSRAVATEPKAPRATASQRRTERMAERVDAWRCANSLMGSAPASWDATPYDVFQLAQWLAGDGSASE
jgi:hypothetical protein